MPTCEHHVIPAPGVARINCDAIAHNTRVLREYAPAPRHLGVVKANAYGHGGLIVARALIDAGYDILGVAQLREAIALMDALADSGAESGAGNRAMPTILSWILPPDNSGRGGVDGDAIAAALSRGIELSIASIDHLEAVDAAVQRLRCRARVHLKVDTGMTRAGCHVNEVARICAEARSCPGIDLVGIWSHFARADEDSPEGIAATADQCEVFDTAVEAASAGGFPNLTRHIGATSAVLWHREAHADMVRDGIGIYGLSPNPARCRGVDLGLRPVMTLEAQITQVRRVPAGTAVSYGATWVADRDTWLALVPLGYGDGVPRAASNRARVRIYPSNIDGEVVGRICMDQFVVALNTETSSTETSTVDDSDATPPVAVGDRVVLFGDPTSPRTPGCPTVEDWAQASDTINYEIVTRIAEHVPRIAVGDATDD